MSIYSSSFDPRHFADDEVTNIAFLEFITALLFGYPIELTSGSIFDCAALHNIWSDRYYRSFVRYSVKYAKHNISPFRFHFDSNRFPYAHELNIPLRLAHDYLSGRIKTASDGLAVGSDKFEFSVVTTDELENIRSDTNFEHLKDGNFGCLARIKNASLWNR